MIRTDSGILFSSNNKLSSHEKISRTLTCILLNERSFLGKATYGNDSKYITFGKDKTMKPVKESVVLRG